MIFTTLKSWYQKKYLNNEPFIFIGLMLFFYLVLTFLGNYIAPILAALVIAYLLDTFVNILHKATRINRQFLVYFVFIIFLIVLLSVIFVLLPIMINQLIDFIKQGSHTLSSLKNSLEELSLKYPSLLTEDRINNIVSWFDTIDWQKLSSNFGSFILQRTAATLPVLFSALIYLFLVPLMIFYFLKDKEKIINWFKGFLPQENGALYYVWNDLKPKLADYVRGKVIEFIIVSITTYIGFAYFDLNYAVLLAFGVGISVIIPYVGMVLVTIPVVMVAMFQYGFSMTFVWMLTVYFTIQALDGNLLVPLLFSEVLNMHPVGVVSAILIFGGMWGLWGIFFAIPLGLLFMSGVNMFRNHVKGKREASNLNLC
ncbi:AI-2E family transporter [Allofrancisella frigidaquae]|uniref:AI-2E family transporter n=1 Tax=Allofrancisella frigidaquae TaxID=1085644 RepID=A0A6M3HU69_9GAMM|nr:AI-2E family transporter [Allofrancisella frigidaquae]KEI35566.1 putative permease PerM [Francisella sp. W12-1067]QIV94793.1 AI-2E family transporter [Allofrancisella frigidaquae]